MTVTEQEVDNTKSNSTQLLPSIPKVVSDDIIALQLPATHVFIRRNGTVE